MSCCNTNVNEILKEYSKDKGNLMDILHKIQDASSENYICDECMQ
jgi:NADH:ubiquinone oxidoreductase subunit E